MNALINLLLFLLPILSSFWIAQTFNPLSSYQPLQTVDGAALYRKQLTNGNEAYLQVIDLGKMHIDQIIGEVDNMGLNEGKYYQGEGEYYSPFSKISCFLMLQTNIKNFTQTTFFRRSIVLFLNNTNLVLNYPFRLNSMV